MPLGEVQPPLLRDRDWPVVCGLLAKQAAARELLDSVTQQLQGEHAGADQRLLAKTQELQAQLKAADEAASKLLDFCQENSLQLRLQEERRIAAAANGDAIDSGASSGDADSMGFSDSDEDESSDEEEEEEATPARVVPPSRQLRRAVMRAEARAAKSAPVPKPERNVRDVGRWSRKAQRAAQRAQRDVAAEAAAKVRAQRSLCRCHASLTVWLPMPRCGSRRRRRRRRTRGARRSASAPGCSAEPMAAACR